MRKQTIAALAMSSLMLVALVLATVSMSAAEAGGASHRTVAASSGAVFGLPSFGPEELPPFEPLGR